MYRLDPDLHWRRVQPRLGVFEWFPFHSNADEMSLIHKPIDNRKGLLPLCIGEPVYPRGPHVVKRRIHQLFALQHVRMPSAKPPPRAER